MSDFMPMVATSGRTASHGQSRRRAVTGAMTRGIHLSRPRAGTVLPCSESTPHGFGAAGVGDPAVLVMTDFRRIPPVTVTEDRSIDEALRDMIRFGVRALLVVRDGKVTGLITSYDIQGERPLQFLQCTTFMRHEEIEVGHIMTRWEEVPVLEWTTVERARVSDLLDIFAESGVTHLVVAEIESGAATVRGLISRTQTERQISLKEIEIL